MSFPSGAATTFAHEISSFSSRAPDTHKAPRRIGRRFGRDRVVPGRGCTLVASQTLQPSSRGLLGSVAAISTSCVQFRATDFSGPRIHCVFQSAHVRLVAFAAS